MDEGLSIGIASQPLFDIPGVLRVDGSPPLYYMLLSVWMDVFGDGPADTQGLSMVDRAARRSPAACGPAGACSAAAPGLICAALCAVNPFLTNYAQETRMYSLMLLLSLLTAAAFLHVFAFRRRALPARVRGLPRAARVHAQLGALHGGGRARRARAVLVRVRGPPRASCATRCSASAAWGCSTCRGCRRCSTRSSTPARRGSTRRSFGAPVQISKGAAGRRHAHRRAAARRRLGHRGDPPAPGEGQGAHRRHRRARSCRWPRWRWPGSSRRSRPPGPRATWA